MAQKRLPQIGKSASGSPMHDDGEEYRLTGDGGSESKSATLRLERWHQMTDAGKSATTLDLTNCNLNQSLGIALAELYQRQKTKTEAIILKENPTFGSESLRHLLGTFDKTCALKSINLRNTGLNDQSISMIIKTFYTLPNLTSVNLGHNHITEEGVELFGHFLHSNTTIQNLSLAHNKLKSEGARVLANALAGTSTLKSLDLSQCRIADEGAVHIGLMLANQDSITELNLSKNPVTEDGVDAFAEIIQRNTGLVQISITGVEKTKLEKIHKITRRNKTFVGDLVPYKLDREMQRLYVQQYKLEVANQQLKDLHHETARIQDAAKAQEAEFEIERTEMNQKANKLVETLDFCTQSVEDLQRKSKALEDQKVKDKELKEAEIESLQARLDAVTAEREAVEARHDEEVAKLESMIANNAGREEQLKKEVEDCKEAQAQAKKEYAETQAKIEEITEQVAALEASSGIKAVDPPPAS